MSASVPAWLMARPVAHRGLHDAANGVIENTPTAARAAIARSFAIECDIQASADCEAMVFHDFTLDRLTTSTGPVAGLTAAALADVGYRAAADRIVDLGAFLSLIAGRVPLVCEIKSRFDGSTALAARAAQIAADYAGPLAFKSFDPDIIAFLRENASALRIVHAPLGMIAMAKYDHPEWSAMSAPRRRELDHALWWERTRPDFLSWNVADLPHAVPYLVRRGIGAPVMTWTVRTPDQREGARTWADQIVCEGAGVPEAD